jgi:hypothetical protein
MPSTALSTLDRFTRAYLVCALWSSTDDDGNPLDADYALSDLSPQIVAQAIEDCADFQSENAADLDLFYGEYGYDLEQAGYDFWLTRNHHGAGFWDRGAGEVGQRLTAAAHAYGSLDLYIGDDNLIHGA